jgi:predicted dehydrogenase
MTLRAAVVGAGIGEEHARALAAQDGVELVAVAARSAESAGRLGERLGVAGRYTSVDELLEREAPDIVVVATPNDLHHQVVTAALEAGAHVACEKPLALRLADARSMARRADELGRRHLTCFTWRFLPAVRLVRELLDAGAIGEPHHVLVRYYTCGFGDPRGPMRWQFDAAAAGSGALGNLGSHAVDLVRLWIGEVEDVSARLSTAIGERDGGAYGSGRVTVDDSGSLALTLAGGVPATIALSMIAAGPRVSVEAVLAGSDGALRFEEDWSAGDAALGRVSRAARSDQRWTPVEVPARLAAEARFATPQSAFRGCFHGMAAELVAAIREDRPAVPDLHQGAAVQAVLDAAVASSAGGRVVSLAEAVAA